MKQRSVLYLFLPPLNDWFWEDLNPNAGPVCDLIDVCPHTDSKEKGRSQVPVEKQRGNCKKVDRLQLKQNWLSTFSFFLPWMTSDELMTTLRQVALTDFPPDENLCSLDEKLPCDDWWREGGSLPSSLWPLTTTLRRTPQIWPWWRNTWRLPCGFDDPRGLWSSKHWKNCSTVDRLQLKQCCSLPVSSPFDRLVWRGVGTPALSAIWSSSRFPTCKQKGIRQADQVQRPCIKTLLCEYLLSFLHPILSLQTDSSRFLGLQSEQLRALL